MELKCAAAWRLHRERAGETDRVQHTSQQHKMENCTSETFQSMNFKSSHSPRRQNICISQQAPPCNCAAPAKAINVVLRIIYGLPRKFACFENSSFCTFPARERKESGVYQSYECGRGWWKTSRDSNSIVRPQFSFSTTWTRAGLHIKAAFQ